MRLSNNSYTTALGVSVEVDERQLERVNTLLKAAPEKALLVYKRAFLRGIGVVRTQASKEIRARYDISASNLEPNQTIRQRLDVGTDGVVGEILFAGGKIPLYRFHPSPKNRRYTTRYVSGVGGWRVTTDVSAADTRGDMLRRRTAFIATFQSGHTGIFSRTGEKTASGKSKVREWYGYSVADMLDYPEAREAIQERAAEVVQDRVDHELLRALDELGKT